MTIPEIYQLWLAGKSLPSLPQRAARGLLDMARNAILTKGVTPKFSVAPDCPTGEKRSLLAAGDQLRELGIAEEGAIYASAAPSAGTDPHWTVDRVSELLATVQKTRAGAATKKPAAGLIERTQAEFARSKELGRQLDAQRTPRPITHPTTPPKATTPKPMTATKAKTTTARPPATPPRQETNDAYLARRVAEQQAAARAVAAAAPRVELRPLAEVSTGELVQLARHEFARPAEKAAAAAELDRRPEVSVFRNGSYSVSTRRQPKK
jgi:hypothetical protein